MAEINAEMKSKAITDLAKRIVPDSGDVKQLIDLAATLSPGEKLALAITLQNKVDEVLGALTLMGRANEALIMNDAKGSNQSTWADDYVSVKFPLEARYIKTESVKNDYGNHSRLLAALIFKNIITLSNKDWKVFFDAIADSDWYKASDDKRTAKELMEAYTSVPKEINYDKHTVKLLKEFPLNFD